MGCCVSSGNSAHKFDRNSAAADEKIYESREPPSSMEEETVKEVLTETPALKPPPPPKNHPPDEDEAPKPVADKVKEEENEIEKKIRVIPTNCVAEHACEFSEISSPSECLSAATFTDKMDDGEEVHQRVFRASPVKLPKNQSFSGDVKREMLPNRALNRRSDQSPVRRNGVVGSARLAQNRDMN
ncbi:uncharacterized protein LOC111012433, partial [Momordica charantia]|uniref:Uncharacterized protein LOC111012433 n=1 Tax=Momordica charantia TaxID=3673 RepID=A0A6J1CMA7_MOMCH